MNPTAEHLRIASMIEAKVQKLTGSGCDDVTIFGEMSDYMPEFKRLIPESGVKIAFLDLDRFQLVNLT
jgi:hypothetical protein